MKRDSRTRMIQATKSLLQTQGYYATGVAQILEKSGAPRGSLYFHFPGGKEQMAIEAVEALGQELSHEFREILTRKQNFLQSVTAILRLFAQRMERSRYQLGCPISIVALEAAPESASLLNACSQVLQSWEDLLADKLKEEGHSTADAKSLARQVLVLIEGALLLAKTHRDTTPLKEAEQMLATLLKHSGD